MKSWDCQYKYKHLNGIWYWYDMIFWKHIQVTCYHFWRSLGLFAPCANLMTFQNSYFNEHRADCKITDEHPMNFGDRYCVKTRWIFKTWWKPGEISRPGENLVNVQNLVKTWWIFKTWWKPGDFFVVNTKKCFTGSKFTKRSVLSLLFGENYVFSWWKWIENLIGPKPGENLVKTWWIFKTWWKPDEFSKPGENWKPGENLVKTWWKPGENSVQTWWKHGESLVKTWWKLAENLVKTWWKLGENLVKTCVNFENLVKTRWKLGENLVKTWWKLGENLVKTWWKPGENLVKTWSKKRSKSFWKPSAAWWKLFEKASWKPGENLMKTLWIFTTWWQPDEMSQPW